MGNKKKFKEYTVDRDISWMYFNKRLLQEAEKKDLPLLERLSFLGLYSNNLDEFYRVRMASLGKVAAADNVSSKERKKALRAIEAINILNLEYANRYNAAEQEILSALEGEGIRLLREDQLNREQQEFLTDFYNSNLNGAITPVWLNEVKDISTMEDNKIYLVVKVKEYDRKSKYALVRLPDETFGRFIRIPASEGFENVMYLDDVIRFCLPLIFIGFNDCEYEAWAFKFTKDAELDMENDADYGIIEKISQGVEGRKDGDPTRVIYDREMPRKLKDKIIKKLKIDLLETEVASGRYQNHRDLTDFPDCGRKDLKYPKWKQVTKPEFVSPESLLDAVRRKDRFIHMPFQSFDGYLRLLREAALGSEVSEIKTTLYRLAKDSKVVKALICAARNGKKVTAVIELMASFDEESNIKWAKKMQEAGIKVIYGVDGLKVHSKLLFLKSKKGDIACIGSGNFHEKNAKRYTDYLMMTGRKSITKDVENVFNFIEKPYTQVKFNQLLVSPNAMKDRILRMLDKEIEAAKKGQEAWVKIKLNNLTEEDVVNKLYEASSAGVKVDLLVRSCCAVIPGIEGISDNMHVVGIIDRFLEHPRILIFCNGGKPKFFFGSADWMPRNLLNRVEVMAPVYDEDMKEDLLRSVEWGLKDTMNGRAVDGAGGDPIQEGDPFRSQEELHKFYLKQAGVKD